MEITTVGAALEIASKVSKGLSGIRGRMKTSKDSTLNEAVYRLWGDFVDLQAIIERLTTENAELRRQLQAQSHQQPTPEIRQVGETNYYFVGDRGPYCQKCWDKNGKLVSLNPPSDRYAGGSGRECVVCGEAYIEKRRIPQRTQVRLGPWS
jgi:hypothetical protein